MSSLVVRRLDDDLVPLLKERAKRHGRSAEEEHREILRQALRPAMTGVELVRRLREAAAGAGEGVDFGPRGDQTPHPAVFE